MRYCITWKGSAGNLLKREFFDNKEFDCAEALNEFLDRELIEVGDTITIEDASEE